MMLGLLIILSLLSLWKIRFTRANQSYLSKGETDGVKGIFAIIILCSHMGGYLSFSDCFEDKIFLHFMAFLGQTMVAPFLFYSGYGVIYSFQHKPGYKKHFFTRRFLKVLLHFDLTVFLYIIVQANLSIYWPPQNYLLCWIGWESVGNSNWFVFVILSLYLIAWIGMSWDDGKGNTLFLFVLLLSICLWVVLYRVAQKGQWWVDTIAAFPLGMFYYLFRERIDHLLFGKNRAWFIAFASLLFVFIGWHHSFGVDVFGVCSCIFCLLLIICSMKLHIGNPVLSFLGRNAFAIYILQRLPMLVLHHFEINRTPSLFIILSIAITLLLAEGFTRLTSLIDHKWIYARES